MATKFKSYDEAKELLTSTKEELQIAKDERKAFAKENGLSLKDGADHSEDPKHGKKWKKLIAPINTKTALIDEIKAYMAENKPKKEASQRAVKYTYPADMTDAGEKKKFRAAERRKAIAGEKAGAKGEEKPSKKKKGKEEPTEEPKAEKSSKKDKSEKSDKSSKKDKKKGDKKAKADEAPSED